MKRITSRIKNLRRKPEADQAAPGRITNETVAEHRERILAGGRRFKYPVQYARVRLIRNTIIITLVTLVALVGLAWWQLYPVQNTGDFFYRLTQIVPLPVAKVDSENVSYSYYLLKLRNAMHYQEQNNNVDFGTNDGKRQLDYYKRQALDDSIAYAYTLKLAREHNITVSDKEVDAFVATLRKQNKFDSQSAYEASILRFYGWTYNEYRESVQASLLKSKVAREIDVAAKNKANDIVAKLKAGADFTQVAKDSSDDVGASQGGGDQGFITKDSGDADGLVAAAAKLQQPGQISGVITGTHGFFIIKLLETNDTQVHFARIYIAFKTFDTQLGNVKNNNGVQEYISVPTNIAPIQQN